MISSQPFSVSHKLSVSQTMENSEAWHQVPHQESKVRKAGGLPQHAFSAVT